MNDLAVQPDTSEHHRGRTVPGEPARVPDNSPAPATARRSRPVRLIIFSGILLIVAIAVGTGIILSNLRSRALTESEREIQNVALILAEQMEHDFGAVESVQTSLIERLWAFGIASSEDYERKMSGYDNHLMLKDRVVGLHHLGTVTLVNSQGQVFNFSRSWPIPDINVADRDFFTALQSDEKLNSVISKPIRNRATGTWVVQFARKVSGPNGEFLGLVLGAIELQSIEQFFARVSLGPNSAISLLHRDGELMVRHPHVESVIGRPIPGGLAVKLVSNSDRGVGRRIGAVGNAEDRLIAAHRVARYPFLIAATTNVAAVLADWWRTVYYLFGIAALAILSVAAGTFLVIRQFKNYVSLERARAEKIEVEKLRENHFQLDTALSNMSQGLVMFNSAAQLVVCNDRYRQIYDLPPDLTKPGCAVVDLLKYRAANGTFFGNPEKYIGDLLAAVAQGKTVKQEMETGDGRIILVVYQAMAGGGWVATHEDITEAKQQEASFRLLFKNNPVPMWVYALDSLRFLAVNDAAVAHYGYSREQFLAMTALSIRPPEEREGLKQFGRTNGGVHDGEQIWRHQKSDGTKIDVAIYSRALSYEGSTAGLVAAIDVTYRKRAEDELRRTQNFLNTVVENVPQPIVVKSVPSASKDVSEYRFTLINRAAEKLFGISRDQMIGKNAHDVYTKDHANLIVDHDSEALRTDHPVIISEHSVKNSDNDIRIVTSRKVAIRDADGKPEYILSMLEDVTERKQAEHRIAHMAHHDTLTDLPNRAAFNECLASALDQAAMAHEYFAILSIDLDRFKEINDVFGHAIGDAVLLEVAHRMQAAAAGSFLARIGGDEFSIIVADGAQPATASALADRLLAAVAGVFVIEGLQLRMGLSIGVAVYPTDGTDAKPLMVNADAALYRAKAEARGSVRFFEPEMDTRLRERLALQNDLRLAIDRGELILNYQPQLRMAGGIVGFEALVRWQCPKRGIVAPGTFIPIAEESSLIISVGEWVLREACREAASWPQPLTIAVNVSPIQFCHGDLPRLVHSILLETGLAPARLELEITEGVLINDFSRAVSILRRLKSLGVQIALDDFGTGYSSLSYLHSFAFDKIKIDRAFIGDLEQNRHSMAIVRAVISLGRSLDLPILAEGVETEAQHAFLVQEGCDEVQGYLTGRPLPIADYAKLVGRQAIAQQNYATAG